MSGYLHQIDCKNKDTKIDNFVQCYPEKYHKNGSCHKTDFITANLQVRFYRTFNPLNANPTK